MKREEYLRMINFGALLSNTSNFLYTYILIALLIFAGIYFTVRTRGVQFRLFPEALRVLGEKKKDGKDISSFQALMISTASRVGTGNIAGVANAIIAATVIGGYGAVFWMWLLALIGAASAFIESTLAQCYKEKHGDNWVGGPAYYIQKALGSRFFGVVFAVLLIACFAYGFNALQAYNAGSALQYYLPGYSESVWPAVVGDFLVNEYKDGTYIRKQKVSIGLTFPIDKNGVIVKLDVVPGRELNKDDYPNTKNLNLYFNEDHWGYKKGSRQKTNIHAQIDHISGKSEERKVIRLLKIWKNTNHQDYKSFMLELFTIKAMASYSGDNNLWDKLKYVMTYIADNVTDESFRLIDPGNSNNNVLSSIDMNKRSMLSTTMRTIINAIDNDSNSVAIYFPINAKYQKQENRYGYKSGSSGPSYPPTSQRFGE